MHHDTAQEWTILADCPYPVKGVLDGQHLRHRSSGQGRDADPGQAVGFVRKQRHIFGDDSAGLVRQQVGQKKLLDRRRQRIRQWKMRQDCGSYSNHGH